LKESDRPKILSALYLRMLAFKLCIIPSVWLRVLHGYPVVMLSIALPAQSATFQFRYCRNCISVSVFLFPVFAHRQRSKPFLIIVVLLFCSSLPDDANLLLQLCSNPTTQPRSGCPRTGSARCYRIVLRLA